MLGQVKVKKGITPTQFIVVGFAVIILLGAILLTMPFSVRSGNLNNFIDALFTATSAVCVTGLVTVDTGTFYNPIGHVIVILLIQIGGLGIISATTFYAMLLGKRIGLKERVLIKEAMNSDSLGGVVRLVRAVLITTISIECIGAVILALAFMQYFPLPKALWYGIFHSISSFCNAGFDLLGQDFTPYCSLIPLQNNPIILITIACLIILGGLGFVTILSVVQKKSFQRLSIHNKLVIVTTAIFIVVGWLFFFFSESQATFSQMGVGDRIVNAFFLSVTPRTAGYTSVDLGKAIPSTLLMIMLFMFVGASPAGTGGGIKTTTFSTLVLAVLSRIRGRDDVEIYGRHIDKDTVYRALTVTAMALSVVFACIMLLTLLDDHDVIRLMFEAFSAWGTVGLSTGITPDLSTGAKIVLIFLMFFGRLGPLTIAFALLQKKTTTHIKYPHGGVIIG
ncbi:MAG: TrkH family potassium uptake protein [Ignavibacteriales bacterium]